jgi:hypothetical protein
MPAPSKPSTPQERAVLVWVAVVFLALMGAVALYFSQRAIELAKPEMAQQLWRIAQTSFGFAAVMALARLAWVRFAT